MSLSAVIDKTTFESLADGKKEIYVKNEKDEQYYLDISGIEAGKLAVPMQESVKKLETKNTEVIGEKKALQDELKAYKDLGKTADELKDLIADKIPTDIKALQEKHDAEIAKIKKSGEEELERVEAANTEELEQAKTQAQKFQADLEKEMKNATISNLQREFKLLDGSEALLDRAFAVLPEAEGSEKRVIRVVENGEVAYKAQSPMTPKQYAEDFINKYPHLVGANGGGGTGGSNNQSNVNIGGKTIRRVDFDSKSPEEKRKLIQDGVKPID